MNRGEPALLVFTRAPVPGEAKSRLIPILGEKGAAELHRAFLINTMEQASASRFNTIQLWCTPDTRHACFDECRRSYNVTLHQQQGSDLGERMYLALKKTLEQHPWAVLIGTDCPMLSSTLLDQAHQVLDVGKEAVLGPSEDGGYYLIGVRQVAAEMFDQIAWGTGRVADSTRGRLKKLGYEWSELPMLRDIDTPEDLEAWQGQLVDTAWN